MLKPLKTMRISTIAKVVLIVSVIFVLITSLIIWNNNVSLMIPRTYKFQARFLAPATIVQTLSNTETRLWLLTLGQQAKKQLRMNTTCAHYPNILDLNYHNQHWQFLTTSSGVIYLYKAYFDARQKNELRILAMATNYNPPIQLFCQIWSKTLSTPQIIPVSSIFHSNKSIEMLLITCLMSDEIESEALATVSLVHTGCTNATNLLKIFYKPNRNSKKNLNICIDPLYFPKEDIFKRLIEWIEIQKLYDFDTLTFYSIQIENLTEKVLSFYQTNHSIQIIPLTFPKFNAQIDQEPSLEETIELNRLAAHDCFYQSIYKYHYTITMSLQDTIILFMQQKWTKFIELWRGSVKILYPDNSYVTFKCIPLLMPNATRKSLSFLNARFVQDISGKQTDCSRNLLNTRRVIFFTKNPEVCYTKCGGFLVSNMEAAVIHIGTNCLNPSGKLCDNLIKLPRLRRHDYIVQHTNVKKNIRQVYQQLAETFPNVMPSKNYNNTLKKYGN